MKNMMNKTIYQNNERNYKLLIFMYIYIFYLINKISN